MIALEIFWKLKRSEDAVCPRTNPNSRLTVLLSQLADWQSLCNTIYTEDFFRILKLLRIKMSHWCSTLVPEQTTRQLNAYDAVYVPESFCYQDLAKGTCLLTKLPEI